MEVRLIQDFRVHVRERKDPATIYYFRISSYLLLVALTVLTSMVLTLMNYNRRVVLDETGTGQQVHGRVPTHHHKLRPLPQFHVASFRHPHAEEHLSVSKSGHCDRGIEPNTSAVIPDRIAKYKSVVNGEAGDIISDQKIIDDHHSISLFKDSYAYYYDHGIEISEVDTWDGTNVTKLGTTEFVTLTVATQKIATKCLDIADFNVESFRNKNMADFDAWDRKVATVLYNCKRTYRLFGEKLTRDFVQFVLNYADSQRTTYLYIVLASAGAVIFAMLSLIPFIVRAHTSVVKVYQVFVRIKKKEYTDLIGLAEEFLEDSNKQFSAIKKKFNDINFKEAQRLEQEAIELAAKKNNGRAKARRGGQVPELPAVITPENKSLQKDEEEESLKAQEMDKAALTSQLEVMETQRKEQSMSASSSRSRNILLAEIVGIAAMFAIYFLVTILIRVNYFAKTKTTMEIVEVIARRKPLLTAVGLFSKEDFTTGTICYDSDTSTRTDCIIFLVENESLFKYYYWEDLDNELKRESLYDNIEAMFPDLYTVIEELSSSSYCSLIENTTESINNCNTMFGAIFVHGLESACYEMLMRINMAHYQLENYLNMSMTVGTKMISDESLINYMDMYEGSMEKGTEHEFSELQNHAYLLFDTITSFDTLDFSILLVLLFVVLLIVFRLFLNQFEFSLWKTKRMLGILPTKYMAEQIVEIKNLIKLIA